MFVTAPVRLEFKILFLPDAVTTTFSRDVLEFCSVLVRTVDSAKFKYSSEYFSVLFPTNDTSTLYGPPERMLVILKLPSALEIATYLVPVG